MSSIQQPIITLRPHQQRCLDAFFNYHWRGNGLIVVPTAGGKSIIIGSLVKQICQGYSNQRILILSHVRELIKQNHEKLMLCWPQAPAGIYSASLGKRQAFHPIVTATIQSVYRKAAELGRRDVVFIDEAHLIQSGDSGMYKRLLADLKKLNPAMVVCGFTATDYRLDSGSLVDSGIFNDVIIEIGIEDLIDDGYLTPPVGKPMVVQADLDGVKITAGEYNIKHMAARFDQKEFLNKALDCDMPFFKDRKSIALFCATIENAEHVADGMRARGIDCEVITGDTAAETRDDMFERFRNGSLRALASVGTMTTGTDIPNIDCVVLFRATQSPGLYQQIIGRGFRVVYGPGDLTTASGRVKAIASGPKPNFLTLDHGGNIERHGPIIAVQKPVKRPAGTKQPPPKMLVRICAICRTANQLHETHCMECGLELTTPRDATANLSIEATDAEIMGTPFSRGERPEWFTPCDATYAMHKEDYCMRVTYYCGVNLFDTYMFFGRGHKATHEWFNQASFGHHAAMPRNAHDAMAFRFQLPSRIQVIKRKKYYEVLRYEFETVRQAIHANYAIGGH